MLAVARSDRRPGIAPLQRGRAKIQSQAVLALLRAVAFVAVALQNGLDVAKEVHLIRRRGGLLSMQRPGCRESGKSDDRKRRNVAAEHGRTGPRGYYNHPGDETAWP